MGLTPDQVERHKRHIMLKEIGGPGVQRLNDARIAIIGAGALGGPCALYLAAAGAGHIEIWDDDRVDRSNLQRQVQFAESDVGELKAERLVARLKAIDPSLNAKAHVSRWSESDAIAADVIIDATDNFETRFALNRVAHTTGRVLVHGAAAGWSGQVSVFASGCEASAPCYQCWVPQIPPEAEACDEVGVVGALTGIVGTQMALEAVKIVTDAGQPLIGRLLLLSGLDGSSRTLALRKDAKCPVCG